MPTLFKDPLRWTASAVGTRLRFALVLAGLSGLIGLVVFEAASSGMRSAAGMALFVIWMQFLLLYALRAVYLQAVAQGRAAPDAHTSNPSS